MVVAQYARVPAGGGAKTTVVQHALIHVLTAMEHAVVGVHHVRVYAPRVVHIVAWNVPPGLLAGLNALTVWRYVQVAMQGALEIASCIAMVVIKSVLLPQTALLVL